MTHLSNYTSIQRLKSGSILRESDQTMRTPIFCLFLTASGSVSALEYTKDILPIMKEHCWSCHSTDEKVKGNLALDDIEEMAEFQIKKFSIIRPKDPEESNFLRLIKLEASDSDAMPPKGDRMPEKDIAIIEQWITEGAAVEGYVLNEETMKLEKAGDAAEMENPAAPEYTNWTSSEGKVIEAKFVRLSGAAVVIVMKNGNSFTVPLDKLSAESAAMATKMGGQ